MLGSELRLQDSLRGVGLTCARLTEENQRGSTPVHGRPQQGLGCVLGAGVPSTEEVENPGKPYLLH